MLGDYRQTRISEYARIYDILIPRDHIFRHMNEEIDFSFVRKELEDKYSACMGRSAEDPVRMFKYLMLKAMHPASNDDLVKRAYTDMSYKFFLGLNPEDCTNFELRSNVLTLEKTQKTFGFLLAYSYLCTQILITRYT